MYYTRMRTLKETIVRKYSLSIKNMESLLVVHILRVPLYSLYGIIQDDGNFVYNHNNGYNVENF